MNAQALDCKCESLEFALSMYGCVGMLVGLPWVFDELNRIRAQRFLGRSFGLAAYWSAHSTPLTS